MLLSKEKIGIHTTLQIIVFISFTIFILIMFSGCAKKEDLRSVGFTEPLKESKVLELSLDSDYMGRKMSYIIYLPTGYGDGTKYPVWYALHGSSSNESMWIHNGDVNSVADELISNGEIEPMIMVFPFTKDATLKEIKSDFDEDGKFDERNMDQFLCKELVPYIDAHYYTVTSADSRYIGGFSMGGMIALRIAFHHTDLFSKVGGYSAAVVSSDYSDKQLEQWLYPNDNFDKIEDITKFDKKKGFDKLNVYLDAGKTNDPFTVGLQSLNDALQKRGIKSEFHLHDGGHTLEKDLVKDYLKFYVAKE